ncbi:hypothetical protein NPIL_397291 [Nephila pilipes]|uniref:Uncharacterized protein n=1 Tax=Nephila pilipes TaxID=299642 RepID=A0A8X6TZ53_NEPPI|nr:hypothetical protein NPIL_397291 [Nephila pilipes]
MLDSQKEIFYGKGKETGNKRTAVDETDFSSPPSTEKKRITVPDKSVHYRSLSSRKEEKFGDSKIPFTLEAK